MTNVIIRKSSSLKGEVYAPPSKSYTQRMLIAAFLSKGKSKISRPLVAEDTDATLRAVRSLGAKVAVSEDLWEIKGSLALKSPKRPIDCGDSGATLRFMIPVAALAPNSSVFTLGPSLAKRPVEPLLRSLRQLGVEAIYKDTRRKPSILVRGGGISGGKTTIPGDVSSQFVSGLMFACPLAREDTEITISTPLESKSYVQMTEKVLDQHGIRVDISQDFRRLHIPAKQTYKPCDHTVPGDYSAASFLLGAGAVTNSKIRVNNLDPETLQGDKAIIEILKKMGVNSHVYSDLIDLEETSGLLEAVEVDVNDVPDLAPVCAVLACYAKGTSIIRNALRLKYKESNRLSSLYLELKKMGAEIELDENSLTVKGPCSLHRAVIDPHNDHRIAMACAVAALGASGKTTIRNAECVRKSYPRFFTDLHTLGADVIGWEHDR
jgi:3-phosphoshikimate 1-carboxyvinyltransferase